MGIRGLIPINDPNMESVTRNRVSAPGLVPLRNPTKIRNAPQRGTPVSIGVAEAKPMQKAGVHKDSSMSHIAGQAKSISKTSQARSVDLIKTAPVRKDQIGDFKTILGR